MFVLLDLNIDVDKFKKFIEKINMGMDFELKVIIFLKKEYLIFKFEG